MRKRFFPFISALLVFLLCSCELFISEPAQGKVYIVSIGIKYDELEHNARVFDGANVQPLRYTASDSINVANCFAELCEKAGREYSVYRLNDLLDVSNPLYPNAVNIENTLGEVADLSEPGDTLILFMSCHGVSLYANQEDMVYGDSALYAYDSGFACYTSNPLEVKAFRNSRFLSLVSKFRGQKCLFTDFCYSGSLISENNVSVDTGIYNLPCNRTGIWEKLFSDAQYAGTPDLYIFSASKPFQSSYEPPETSSIKHSYFAAGLLQALGWDDETYTLSPAIPARSANVITMQSIAAQTGDFVFKKLPSRYKYEQNVKISGGSEDAVLFKFTD